MTDTYEQDHERARQIYETAVRVVPHKQFTFAKLWIMFARFEVRRLNLPAARKILGTAIGMCPKEALFKGYIQLEFDVCLGSLHCMLYGNADYVRHSFASSIVYGHCTRSTSRYVRDVGCRISQTLTDLQYDPTNSAAWIKYAELESQLEDFPRVRAIYELGVSQTALSMPELLWKAYIDFETEEGEREKARALYERLVQISGHVKVWISYATFEAEPIPVPRAMREEAEDDEEEEVQMVEGDPARARLVFDRGYKDLKSKGLKHEVCGRFGHFEHFWVTSITDVRILRAIQRVVLLEIWKVFEEKYGTAEDVVKVQRMMPITSKRRIVDKETGQTVEGTSVSALLRATATVYTCSLVQHKLTLAQIGTLCSQTTSGSRTPRRSSSYRWRMLGRRRKPRVAAGEVVVAALHCRGSWLLRTRTQMRVPTPMPP